MNLKELGLELTDLTGGDFLIKATANGKELFLTREAIRELRHLSLDAERLAQELARRPKKSS